jgi:hypothetical protein
MNIKGGDAAKTKLNNRSEVLVKATTIAIPIFSKT